jgi:hypothetical protein
LAELPSDEVVRPPLSSYSSSFLPLGTSPSPARLSQESGLQERLSELSSHTTLGVNRHSDHVVNYRAAPVPQAAAGLIALFQKPVQLGEKAPDVQPRRPLVTTSRDSLPLKVSANSSSASALKSISSANSLISQRSEPCGPSQSPIAQIGDQSIRNTPSLNTRARTQSFGPGPPRTSATGQAQLAPASGHQRGLSQLFVYQPRPTQTSASDHRTIHESGESTFFELEGSTPSLHTSPMGTGDQSNHLSRDHPHIAPKSSRSMDDTQYGSRDDRPTSAHTVSAYSRDMVDSAAWHRRTEMLRTQDQGPSRS